MSQLTKPRDAVPYRTQAQRDAAYEASKHEALKDTGLSFSVYVPVEEKFPGWLNVRDYFLRVTPTALRFVQNPSDANIITIDLSDMETLQDDVPHAYYDKLQKLLTMVMKLAENHTSGLLNSLRETFVNREVSSLTLNEINQKAAEYEFMQAVSQHETFKQALYNLLGLEPSPFPKTIDGL